LVALACVGPLASASAEKPQRAESVEMLHADSRAPYVHRLTLYDHTGAAISPEDEPALPYSPKMTCGKCHPYGQISRGWHFNACDPNVPPGRPGEPWFLVDEKTGTVLPVSGRRWPGTQTPRDAGLTNWQFTLRFGRHFPGGGFGEPDDKTVQGSPEALRWGVSGKLEIDCMICHSADQQHDPAEAARQIEKQNFRWAPTVALGLAVVRGEARKAPDDWDPSLPPNPDYPDRTGPRLIYDKTRFDPDNRVLFDITGRPPATRCYFCHSSRVVGAGAPAAWQTDQDIHLTAGLTCIDCHRNGIDHMITRGYEGEAPPATQPAIVPPTTQPATSQPARASLSCRGCHLGEADAADVATALGGRLRAPHPQHRGLPPLHLEKLTCTACHSGPWPEMDGHRFQTSMAHGLGLAARTRDDNTAPAIGGPAFVREGDEPIGVYRVALRAAGNAAPWYGAAWPMAHDVRPAAQGLGVRGCSDCHALKSPFFWGDVSAASVTHNWELMHYDPVLGEAWALGFYLRPAFKYFAFGCAAIIALVLIRNGLDGVGALLRRIRP
jgi:hypothetical protein